MRGEGCEVSGSRRTVFAVANLSLGSSTRCRSARAVDNRARGNARALTVSEIVTNLRMRLSKSIVRILSLPTHWVSTQRSLGQILKGAVRQTH